MKKTQLLFIFFIIILFNTTCVKDEIVNDEKPKIENLPSSIDDNAQSNDGLRDGLVDVIFYRTSLTSDNYLLYNKSISRVRTHKIYNKSKVKNIKFTPTGNPDVNVGSVFMKHYNLEITYNDNTTEKFTAYSKKSLNNFTFIPSGENLLSATHPSKFISYETTGESSINPNIKYYNVLRDEIYSLYKWTVRKENEIIMTKELEPKTKNSKQFTVDHQN